VSNAVIQQCDTCKFWLPNIEPAVGICRRNAPVPREPTEQEVDDGMTEDLGFCHIWPVTLAIAWCGEYECKGSNPA